MHFYVWNIPGNLRNHNSSLWISHPKTKSVKAQEARASCRKNTKHSVNIQSCFTVLAKPAVSKTRTMVLIYRGASSDALANHTGYKENLWKQGDPSSATVSKLPRLSEKVALGTGEGSFRNSSSILCAFHFSLSDCVCIVQKNTSCFTEACCVAVLLDPQ